MPDQRRARTVLIALAFLLMLTGLPAKLQAEPYLPASDDSVLASVPRAEQAQRDSVMRLSRELDAAPQRADLAASLAHVYIGLHTEVGDPRYLGYAAAAVTPFVDSPSLEIRLVQADMLQAGHDFDAARQILESVVRSHPDEARAWLLLAAIGTVQGDYAVSRNACARLFVLGKQFEAIACAAEVTSLTGRSRAAYAQLSEALDAGAKQPAAVRAWAHTIAAEIALRRDDSHAAQTHFETALELKPNIYALVGLADLLIARQQYEAAMRLLRDAPAADAIVLRRALVLERLDDAGAGALAQRAARRIAALERRGDDRHAREEAFFALYVGNQPRDAVTAARRNWEMQRESIDAQLLLGAALAAGEPGAAAPVLTWMRENQSDDLRLLRLARQLGSRS